MKNNGSSVRGFDKIDILKPKTLAHMSPSVFNQFNSAGVPSTEKNKNNSAFQLAI